MKRFAHLSALGIVVPLRKNEYFFDDGYVKDVDEWANQLQRQHGKMEVEKGEKGDFVGGICCDFHVKQPDGNTAKHYHIFYRDVNYLPGKIFFKAHEELHLLSMLGKLQFLLLNPRFIFSGYFLPSLKCLIERNEEGLANTIAMYAVYRHGIFENNV